MRGDWREVAKGVHRLTAGIVNFYLVEDGGKFTLIDAGAPKDHRVLVSALESLHRTVDDLEAVILTHAHSDHAGFAERVRSSVGAKVWVHQADLAVAKGAKPGRNDGKVRGYLLKPAFYKTTFSLVLRGAAKIVPVQEASTFGDGETLDLPGRPKVVHASGHTPGSAVILLEDRRVVFTGDALVTWNPLTGRVGPQIMPSAFNANTPQALRSIHLLSVSKPTSCSPATASPGRTAWRRRSARLRPPAPRNPRITSRPLCTCMKGWPPSGPN